MSENFNELKTIIVNAFTVLENTLLDRIDSIFKDSVDNSRENIQNFNSSKLLQFPSIDFSKFDIKVLVNFFFNI